LFASIPVFLGELKLHAKFQNPRTTPPGRKVKTREKERLCKDEKKNLLSTWRCHQQLSGKIF
jgi:hypothetical protein